MYLFLIFNSQDNKMKKFNPSYIGPRDDVFNLIPANVKRVLDVGCSIGSLGRRIKGVYNATVFGIEIDNEMAKIAKKYLDKVIISDVEKINFDKYFKPKYFDCIIFADVLEHLKDPWSVLKNIKKILKDDGFVIASIPNIRHYSTITNLLFKGYWPYNERGLFDRTHLRFFTLKNIKEMFKSAELEIIKIRSNYRIIERPSKINKISKIFAFPLLREFITFQYLIIAKK